MPVCIYCKKYQHKDEFSHREHVVPQSFGKFKPDNLILNSRNSRIKYVCNTCNNYLSKLERWLGRDSFEGYVLRSKYIKHVESKDRRRSKMILVEGPYKGLLLEYREDRKVYPLPQIALQHKNGKWDYFTLDRILNIDKSKYNLKGDSFRAFQLSDQEAKNAFEKIGINFSVRGDLDLNFPKDILCEITMLVDKIIQRVIAKIAFNYFAYFNKKKIILNKEFDPVRDFVLNGGSENLVRISNDPILAGEDQYKRINGHIVTLKVVSNYLIAQVSLFNFLKYDILLARLDNTSNVKYGFGHFFNMKSNTIQDIKKTEIQVISIDLIVPSTKLWTP